MKTKILIGVAVTLLVVVAGLKLHQQKRSQKVGSGVEQKNIVRSDNKPSLNLPTSTGMQSLLRQAEKPVDYFEGIQSVADIMDKYRSSTDQELKTELRRLQLTLKNRNLLGKANDGSITKSERKDLAYFVRANTALHRLLLDRELAQN